MYKSKFFRQYDIHTRKKINVISAKCLKSSRYEQRNTDGDACGTILPALESRKDAKASGLGKSDGVAGFRVRTIAVCGQSTQVQGFVEQLVFEPRKMFDEQIRRVPGQMRTAPAVVCGVTVIVCQRKIPVECAGGHRDACGVEMSEIGELHLPSVPEHSGVDSPEKFVEQSECQFLTGTDFRHPIGRGGERACRCQGILVFYAESGITRGLIYLLSASHPVIMCGSVFQFQPDFQPFVVGHGDKRRRLRNVGLCRLFEPTLCDAVVERFSALPRQGCRKQQPVGRFDPVFGGEELLLKELHVIASEASGGQRVDQGPLGAVLVVVAARQSGGE